MSTSEEELSYRVIHEARGTLQFVICDSCKAKAFWPTVRFSVDPNDIDRLSLPYPEISDTWYILSNLKGFNTAFRDSVDYHFCSLPCLAKWIILVEGK